ncbi:substrate-binding periplasmic protein [Alkalimonas amylolytica]|uniref:Amino acid ABC transporter substrate-binding protein, PAAT family (TC 3.A.1.3.-) n=1 Tax=Alkalimonas amylolytica TaxID=152573 RepID=A0A1H4FL41_ALKAM|nr:transporter substrate-binding domain-containing protein [Alkalimonas amylolytica]SEA97787.1 amino acid ABC transporter substrate-binding protein, PAAT family (TC 3.A.1.3.-) [Alkalimonas amylolytica]
MKHLGIWLLIFVGLLSSVSLQAERIVLASSNYHPHYAADLPQQGVVTEIIRQAFALQGIQIDVEFMPFGRALHQAKMGHYAGLIAAWYDEDRVEHFLYSQPMYANHIVLFKRKAMPLEFRNYQQLADARYRLGVVQGYAQPEGLLRARLNTIAVASDEQAFRMLALERVDLVPADKLNGLYLLQTLLPEYADDIEYMEPVLEQRPMYLVLSKQDPRSEELMERFNRGLQQLQASNQYRTILHSLLPATGAR